jgi:hypothetical protein
VLTAKPPLPRYGVEMPRVNPFATLVVSFISFHVVGDCLTHVSDVLAARKATLVSHGRSHSFQSSLFSYLIASAMLTCLRHSTLRMFSIINRLPLTRVCSHNDLKQASTSNQKAAVAPRILVGQVQLALRQPPPPTPQPPATEQQCCPAGI